MDGTILISWRNIWKILFIWKILEKIFYSKLKMPLDLRFREETFILATFTHRITKIKNKFSFFFFLLSDITTYFTSVLTVWLIQMNSKSVFRLFFLPIKSYIDKNAIQSFSFYFSSVVSSFSWIYANLFMKWSLCHDGSLIIMVIVEQVAAASQRIPSRLVSHIHLMHHHDRVLF